MLLHAPQCAPCAQPRAFRRRVSVAARPRLSVRSAVQRSTHAAPDGVPLEVLRCAPATPTSSRPPLLFVHGSFHAAWCWETHWLPFFAAAGYDAYALSLRGQGGSGARPGGGAAGTLEQHAADVASLAKALPAPPVLVGHSFGGLVVQQCVSSRVDAPPVAGVALLCSVPPDGNSAMVRDCEKACKQHYSAADYAPYRQAGRMLRATPLEALRVTYAFISRAFEHDAALCRFTFFSPELEESALLRYQAALAANAACPRLLDLRQLGSSLPVPPQRQPGAPVFVAGAALDAVVDAQGVRDTAAVWGTTPVVLPRIAHDVMLDARWEEAAAALLTWLAALPKAAA